MFRLENGSAPIEIIYGQVHKDWASLSEYFQKLDPRGCPLLAVYNVKDVTNEGYKIRETLEFYPDEPDQEVINHVITRTFDTHGEARYSQDNHAVILNRATLKGDLTDTLTHEVTHSIVTIKNDEIPITLDELSGFNGYYPIFGHDIHEVLNKLGIRQFKMGLNEFFPPIGQSHLIGKDFKSDGLKWLKIFYSLENIRGEYADFRQAMYAHSLVRHLPQLAGELMVKSYEGDAAAIMREHPKLALLDGTELWNNYTLPLLTTGKVF